MYLKKETLEQIKRKYSVLIVSDDDVVDAFNLVNDIMTAEADAIKEREPDRHGLYQPPGVCRL